MTPRDLFRIILKVFGLLFIKDIFGVVTQLLPTAYYLMSSDTQSQAMVTAVLDFLYVLVYLLLAFYLLVKSDLVIDKLKLDKDYDQETFQFTMQRSTVLSIVIMVIGGLLIVEGIPTFLGQLASYYLRSRDRYRQSDPPLSYMLISLSKIVIGFLLIKEKRTILKFIERYRQA